MAIYKTIVKYGNEVIAPYIVDSPNQQEQSKINYSKILSLIRESIPTGAQLILCAMRNDIINDFIKAYNVKTISILGSTSPDKIKPYGENGYYVGPKTECKYCWKKKCNKLAKNNIYTPCIESIDVEDILVAIDKNNLLQKNE